MSFSSFSVEPLSRYLKRSNYNFPTCRRRCQKFSYLITKKYFYTVPRASKKDYIKCYVNLLWSHVVMNSLFVSNSFSDGVGGVGIRKHVAVNHRDSAALYHSTCLRAWGGGLFTSSFLATHTGRCRLQPSSARYQGAPLNSNLQRSRNESIVKYLVSWNSGLTVVFN